MEGGGGLGGEDRQAGRVDGRRCVPGEVVTMAVDNSKRMVCKLHSNVLGRGGARADFTAREIFWQVFSVAEGRSNDEG